MVDHTLKTDSVTEGLGWLRRHNSTRVVVNWFLDSGKHEVFVHGRFAEFLLNLRLKDVQLVLHVPIYVREALLGCVVIRVLTLFVGEGGHHAIVVFLYFGRRVLSLFIVGRTLAPHFPHTGVIHNLGLRLRCLFLI